MTAMKRMDTSAKRLHKADAAKIAEHVGTDLLQMSRTSVTKNCAINIDHELGRSAGELSACWVYFKDKHGKLVGSEGAAFILTHDKQLLPMWQVIFYGGQTLERHQTLYEAVKPYMTSRVRRLIKEQMLADLVRERMLGKPASTTIKDGLLGMRMTHMVVDEWDHIKTAGKASHDDQLDTYNYLKNMTLTSGGK